MSNSNKYIPNTGGHVPEDKDQRLVQTPYGDGLTIRTRNRYYDHSNNGSTTNNDSNATNSNEKQQHVVKIHEIELQSWKKNIPIPVTSSSSNGGSYMMHAKPTMLYTSIQHPSIEPVVGNEVICIYGRGKLIEIRKESVSTSKDIDHNDNETTLEVAQKSTSSSSTSSNDIYVVKLSSWRLTERSTITCYLNKSSIHVLRSKKLYEMNKYERIERAIELKTIATEFFIKKLYESALSSYRLAIDAVRYIQHQPHSPNALRADLLIIMITCHNNAATCCLQLKLWNDTKKHSKNAEILVDALHEKATIPTLTNGGTSSSSSSQQPQQQQQTTSKILAILNHDGYNDIKLFGEYKIKSMLLYSRALYELGDIELAIGTIKKAIDIVELYIQPQNKESKNSNSLSLKQLESNYKELYKLLKSCKDKKKKQFEKEKLRAQAMFGGGGSSPSPSSPKSVTAMDEKKINGKHHNDQSNGTKVSSSKTNGMHQRNNENENDTEHTTTTTIKEDTITTEKLSELASDRGLKKRVTFSENIQSHNIDSDATATTSTNKKNGKSILSSRSNHNTNNDDEDDDEWDYESIVGLSGLLVGGALIGIAFTYFMFPGRK